MSFGTSSSMPLKFTVPSSPMDIGDEDHLVNGFPGQYDDYNDDNFVPDDEEGPNTDVLEEAPIPEGAVEEWIKARSLRFDFDPVINEGIVWIGSRDSKEKKMQIYDQDKKLFPTKISGLTFAHGYTSIVLIAFNALSQLIEQSQSSRNDQSKVNLSELLASLIAEIYDKVELVDSDDVKTRIADALNILNCFAVVRFSPQLDIGRFLTWINRADPGPSIEETRDIMMRQSPSEHGLFWPNLIRLAIRGQLSACFNWIKSSINENIEPKCRETFSLTMQLLRSYPDTGQKANFIVFKKWKESIGPIFQLSQEISNPSQRQGLYRLFNILNGDRETILTNCDTWYEAIGALLKFHDPSPSRVQEFYKLATSRLSVDTTLTWEEGCSAVFSGQYLNAVQCIEQLDLCLAATMVEFCKHQGMLDNYYEVRLSNESEQIRRWLLSSHAKQCLTEPGIVDIGVRILEYLGGELELQTIAEFLPHFDIQDDMGRDWALEIAGRLGLNQCKILIHRSAAMKNFRKGSYYKALLELDQAEDVNALNFQAWALFDRAIVDGNGVDDEFIKLAVQDDSELDIPPRVREFLAPYAVLAQFFTAMESGLRFEAGKCISSVISFPFLPKKYHGLVVILSLPLLDRTKPRVFSVSDLVTIITAVDNWQIDQSGKANEQGNDSFHSGLDLLEKSLAQVPSNVKDNDWRKYFETGTLGRDIIKLARELLAKEISRAYLEGA